MLIVGEFHLKLKTFGLPKYHYFVFHALKDSPDHKHVFCNIFLSWRRICNNVIRETNLLQLKKHII